MKSRKRPTGRRPGSARTVGGVAAGARKGRGEGGKARASAGSSLAAAELAERKGAVQAIIRDAAEREKKEAELHRLNRTLNALSHSDRAMMRATDEAAYMDEVCKIIVDDCGHAMVWIGFAQEDEGKTVRPVAHAGFEKGYLETLHVTWADTERGRGPTGTAIRTGKPSACRNMLTDPNFKPWREEALKRGYASSIVLPMMAGGKAFGAINIYSREPDAFSKDEVKLLSELANDLAHGITAIRMRAARARAEDSLARERANLQSIFDVVNVGMLLVDDDGAVQRVNNAVSRWVGKDLSASRGAQPGDLLGCIHTLAGPAGCGHTPHCPTCPIRSTFESVLRSGEPVHDAEAEATLSIGGSQVRLWLEVSADPLVLDGRRHVVLALNNITARKRAEAELSRSNRDLEQFAYVASHDLQEPLRMVAGFLQLLRDRHAGKLDGKAKEYIGFAVEGAGRMSQLISDLLEYSRVQTRTPQPAPTDMKTVFRQAVANCQASIRQAQAAVTCEDLPTVLGDQAQLVQLLQNLLGNAVKFRRPDAPPEVRVGARRQADHWLFWVQDNGIGIQEDQAERLFLIFQRLHAQEKYPGTGIGLAICKKIVERHGGRIWVEPMPGGGSKFLFTIPAR